MPVPKVHRAGPAAGRQPGRRRIAAALATLLLAACGDLGSGPDPGSGGTFAIGVGAGTQPLYTWTAGPAIDVQVFRAAALADPVWAVASPVQRNIGSPVRHGTVPAGALLLRDTEPALTRGVLYRVQIRLADGQQAFQEFRP
jgi:hypothetical protein